MNLYSPRNGSSTKTGRYKHINIMSIGLAESNGSLLPDLRRDSLHVTCGLTACTPGSAPGPTLGNEYGKTLPNIYQLAKCSGQNSVERTKLPMKTLKMPVLFIHVLCHLQQFPHRKHQTLRFVSLKLTTGNESVPIQLAQCWLPGSAISNAKI